MELSNNYYSIAMNDYLYLSYTIELPFYNNIAIACQQIAEKLLKSVGELCAINNDVMNSHNLRRLNTDILHTGVDLQLDNRALSMLKDYYFEARYPGDEFVVVSKEECAECVDILNSVIEAVNRFRGEKGLPVEEIEIKTLKNKKPKEENEVGLEDYEG